MKRKSKTKLPLSPLTQNLIIILGVGSFAGVLLYQLFLGVYSLFHGNSFNLGRDFWLIPSIISQLAPVLYFGLAYWLSPKLPAWMTRSFFAFLAAFVTYELSMLISMPLFAWGMLAGHGTLTMFYYNFIPIIASTIVAVCGLWMLRRFVRPAVLPVGLLVGAYALFVITQSVSFMSPQPAAVVMQLGAILAILASIFALTYLIIPAAKRSDRIIRTLAYPLGLYFTISIVGSLIALMPLFTQGQAFINITNWFILPVGVGYIAVLVYLRVKWRSS